MRVSDEPDPYPDVGSDEPAVEADGRRARAGRSRVAVLDAVLELFKEGHVRPSVDAVADRAGVSRRSVFRHFDDLQSLYAAAIERHVARIAPLMRLPEPGPTLDDRIDALVRQRGRLYEEMTPVRVVTERLLGRVDMIDEQVEIGRLALRDQLRRWFEPELNGTSEDERGDLLDALEVVSSWGAWHVLRTQQGCTMTASRRVMARVLRGLLAGTTGR